MRFLSDRRHGLRERGLTAVPRALDDAAGDRRDQRPGPTCACTGATARPSSHKVPSAAERFDYLYTPEELAEWDDPIRELAERDRAHLGDVQQLQVRLRTAKRARDGSDPRRCRRAARRRHRHRRSRQAETHPAAHQRPGRPMRLVVLLTTQRSRAGSARPRHLGPYARGSSLSHDLATEGGIQRPMGKYLVGTAQPSASGRGGRRQLGTALGVGRRHEGTRHIRHVGGLDGRGGRVDRRRVFGRPALT